MKKLTGPWVFAIFLVGSLAPRAPGASPDHLSEAIILTPQPGAEREDVQIAQCQERAGRPDARLDAFERLGWAYIAKARRTLDAGYYKLAEKVTDAMDARFGVSDESRLLRGHVLHNLHRFHQAEAIARALVNERGSPEDFALLSDALMEQGRLGEAVAACQRFVDLKPGVEAYSRIAHLRWLKGDLTGATAMMEAAERATSPADPEGRAWVLVRLAGYYLQGGSPAGSLVMAESALKLAPSYPPALLARGRALLALGKNEEAAGALRRAAELNPLPEYQWWLADVLRAAGRTDEATKVERELETRGEASDPRTLALWLATKGEDRAKAVRLADEELANRADVLTHDARAWALAASGDVAHATEAMRAALAEKTKDARLLWHAGEIALLGGDREAAKRFFAEARPFAASLTPGERARLTQRLADGAAVAQAP